MSVRGEILDGMANLLWASAWATHAEGHDCTSLSGVEITSVMPRVPAQAHTAAKQIASKIEKANAASLDELWKRAVAADTKDGYRQGTPEAFGGDLVMQAMGSGVSWFDDHAEFPLKVPYVASDAEFVLRIYANDHCKDSGNDSCNDCGDYNRDGAKKCQNCGKQSWKA